MQYGDEYFVEVAEDFDTDELSSAQLARLFKGAMRITSFDSAADNEFIDDPAAISFSRSVCYRIDADSMIEINNACLKRPIVVRNRVADIISFQFVSAVKRSELLGKRKNVHDMGPALLITAVPEPETTYRMPKTNVPIQTVVVHTTLSTLLERLDESATDYPIWLEQVMNGVHDSPRQRVFFLEEVHRDSIWSCFHLPVSGSLLGHWMAAKFNELLAIGLQILKNSRSMADSEALDFDRPAGDKIRRARTILGMEYANPPPLPALARQLGISETRLKSGFKAVVGTTVMQYCLQRRFEAARFLLKENRHSISEIASIVGYDDHSAFSRAFRRHCGYSPRDWRRNQVSEGG